MQRIANLQKRLPAIVEGLVRQGALIPEDRLSSIYGIGSYPWVEQPADIDLFLIVDGEFDWIVYTSDELCDWDLPLEGLGAGLAVEIVGYETLMQAKRGKPVRNAERLRLRHTLLYGSVLLAGQDIFEKASISRHALNALRKDLLEDRKRSQWPELSGDRAKIRAKRKWRRTEANAMWWYKFRLA